MADVLLPIMLTIFMWWFATGAILTLDGLRGRALGFALLGATGFLVAALIGAAQSAQIESVGASYCGFICALVIWGWVEFAFLTGVLTGPSSVACPPCASFARRLRLAIAALIHHELVILALAGLMAAISWQQPNPIALYTFLLLWVMRQSAKINLFLGAWNFSEKLLPAHLSHLVTFFRRARMNVFFPVSLALATLLTFWLFDVAFDPAVATHQRAAFLLLGTLSALAVLEHLFLILPMPMDALWVWGSRLRVRISAGGESL